MSTVLPTYEQYKAQVDILVDSGKLTSEQAIILISVYRNHLSGRPTNINYLMRMTGCNWRHIHWQLNGLVQRGAIRKIDQKWYQI